MDCIDLFCGCGGLSKGFSNKGFSIIAAFENWDAAIQCYTKNFKHKVYKHDLHDWEKAIELIEEKAKLNQARAPRLLGKYNDNEIFVIVGKYGPYIKFNNQNITLEKGSNAATLTLEEAIQQITSMGTKNVLVSFPENDNIKVVNGRYGAYITNGTDNFKIPKDVAPQKLTFQEVTQIISQSTPTAKKRFIRKK